MSSDFSHLPRLLPQESHAYERLEVASGHLLDCMRRERFFDPGSYQENSEALAACLRLTAEALKGAGAEQAPWQWEAATASECEARQLLTMGEAATPEWVRRVLNSVCVHDGVSWRRVRQHVARFAEAVLLAVKPDAREAPHPPAVPTAERPDPLDHALALLLTVGPNAKKIAREVGVPLSTLRGWPKFREHYSQLRAAGERAKRGRPRGRRAGGRDFEVTE
jgi:hypothetical protein